MGIRTRTLLGAAVVLLALPTVASAAPAGGWAPADDATIHPGVQTVTDGGGQCTANFIFENGAEVYIGQAAHCAGTGAATDTNGCTATSMPLGTSVEIQGATQPGTLVYSSWLSMQQRGEDDANACAYNDFALVRVHPDDHDLVNPSIPVFGGPAGIDPDGTTFGESVYTYGNSSLRLGLTQLSPHVGTSLGTSGGGWTHSIYTITPGLPGDSGSAVVSSNGEGLGILVTLTIAPLAGSNGVTDLGRALAYANAHGGIGTVTLADGTESFSGSPLSILGGLFG